MCEHLGYSGFKWGVRSFGRLLKTLRASASQENEDDHCSDFCLKHTIVSRKRCVKFAYFNVLCVACRSGEHFLSVVFCWLK